MRTNWPHGVGDTLLTRSASKLGNTVGIYASQGCTRASGIGGNQPVGLQPAWTAAVQAMNAQAMRDFLPDGLPSVVRNAAMLPSSVLSAYLQEVQRQQAHQQQQLDPQMRTSESASSTAPDPVVVPPHPGSYGAVGPTPQHTSWQGSCSRSVDIGNNAPLLHSAGPAAPLRITADSIVSSPLPAAATAPAPATLAGAPGSVRAPAAVASVVGSNSSKQMMPLIDYIERALMNHTQQQLSPGELAEADCASEESLRQSTRQLMRADSLHTHQQVYVWLNEHLTGIQIRTELGAKIIDYKGVAYLSPLPPASIYHKPTAAASMTGAQAESSPPQAAEAVSGVTISCEQHLLQEYNIRLQHPELPCVAVKLAAQACQKQNLKLREQFIHYPLELCSVLLARLGEPKRGPACDPWPETILQGISTSSGAAYRACVPQWVANGLNDFHRRSVRATAAAVAAPTDVETATATTAPASSSICVAIGSMDQQSGPHLHRNRANSSTYPPYRPVGLTQVAQTAPAPPSAECGGAALALPAAYGIAAPNPHQPATVADGLTCLATDTYSSHSTDSSRCSTPDLPASTGATADHADSRSEQPVSRSPVNSPITTSSNSKVLRPLSDVAEEFLEQNYPAASACCHLLHAETLQSPKYQDAYLALHQALVGLKVRVQFGKSVRNTRDLKLGLAYLDPRPPRDIMHTNHDKVVVRSADGTESTPRLISVQDYLFHKYGVHLQQPEWPCIGYQRGHSACKDTPDQQNHFMTYPLEFCSARATESGELKRGPICHPDVSMSSCHFPVHTISIPGTGRTATASLPPWIADLLNEKRMQHMAAEAVGPMHNRRSTQQSITDELQLAGLNISATAQRTPGAAGLNSQFRLAPAGLDSSAAAAAEHITANGTHGSAESGIESAGQQPHLRYLSSSQSNCAVYGGGVPAPPMVMDPSAAGIMLAAFSQQLQLVARPSYQRSSSASRAVKQSQAGTAVLPAEAAASMMSCPSSAASSSTPATGSDGTQCGRSARITSQGSTSSSNSSTRPSLQPSSKKGGSSSSVHVRLGLQSLLSQLLPTKQQKEAKASAVGAVCNAVQFGISEFHKMEWQIVEVHQAGSFAKGTSLNGSSDLDILAKIKCHNNADFHRCRKEFLGAVTRHLRRPPDASGSLVEIAKRGWQLRDCHPRYFVKLEHPELNLQLDIQVALHFGPKEQQKEQLLTPLLNSVGPHKTSEACDVRCNGCAPSATANATGTGGRDMHSDRQRVTNLTELMTDVVKKVEQRSRDAHKVHGMGRLCTDIIRLMKAWSKHGLPKAMSAISAASEQPALPADASKAPPGYIWEIFVVYVLEQGLKQGKRYTQADPLQLLLDVLSSASKQLRSSMQKSEAIILEVFYTYEQAMQFHEEWGDDGCPYAPYVISPVDPTYNCTENAAFRHYDALADAAGALHESLCIAQHIACGWQWLCVNSTLGPVVAAYPLGQ